MPKNKATYSRIIKIALLFFWLGTFCMQRQYDRQTLLVILKIMVLSMCGTVHMPEALSQN